MPELEAINAGDASDVDFLRFIYSKNVFYLNVSKANVFLATHLNTCRPGVIVLDCRYPKQHLQILFLSLPVRLALGLELQ